MSSDPDAHRAQNVETWRRMAPGWERRVDWLRTFAGPVNEWIVERAQPGSGQTILDLASGPGELGFLAAERVGAEGRVICADIAPEMLDAARRLGESRGVSNVEYRLMDAEDMTLEGDSVDVVLCRWAYMLMTDPSRAMAETRRVLRDGGALCLAVFGAPERNPWLTVAGGVLVERGHMPPPRAGVPGIFALADPQEIRRLVGAAGFEEPDVEEIPFEFGFSSFDDYWDVINHVAGVIAEVLARLPEHEQEEVRSAVEERIAAYRSDDGSYVLPALSLGALAR